LYSSPICRAALEVAALPLLCMERGKAPACKEAYGAGRLRGCRHYAAVSSFLETQWGEAKCGPSCKARLAEVTDS